MVRSVLKHNKEKTMGVDAICDVLVTINDQEEDGQLLVNCTKDGIVLDVVDKSGEILKTFCATAQELADDYCKENE